MQSRKVFFARTLFYFLVAAGALALSGPLTSDWGQAMAAAVETSGERLMLPAPDKTGGAPLMQALAQRKSTRSFSKEEVPLQEVSNLLWATWGVNRPNGFRTAPTARNKQEVAVYAVMAGGIWLYDGKTHSLTKVSEKDPGGELEAPLTLAYAAKDDAFGGMHVGSLYQNAGLYCASAGLANVVKAGNVSVVADSVRLPDGYRMYVIQSIGLFE